MTVKEYENEGRKKLKTVFPTINWQFMPDEKTNFDAYAKYNNKLVIAEIKTRDFGIFEYDDCILEYDKYVSMSSYNDVDEIIYVAHYSNGKTATWNLSQLNMLEFEVITQRMNITTAKDREGGAKHKKVILLPLSIADIRYTDSGIKTTQYLIK